MNTPASEKDDDLDIPATIPEDGELDDGGVSPKGTSSKETAISTADYSVKADGNTISVSTKTVPDTKLPGVKADRKEEHNIRSSFERFSFHSRMPPPDPPRQDYFDRGMQLPETRNWYGGFPAPPSYPSNIYGFPPSQPGPYTNQYSDPYAYPAPSPYVMMQLQSRGSNFNHPKRTYPAQSYGLPDSFPYSTSYTTNIDKFASIASGPGFKLHQFDAVNGAREDERDISSMPQYLCFAPPPTPQQRNAYLARSGQASRPIIRNDKGEPVHLTELPTSRCQRNERAGPLYTAAELAAIREYVDDGDRRKYERKRAAIREAQSRFAPVPNYQWWTTEASEMDKIGCKECSKRIGVC